MKNVLFAAGLLLAALLAACSGGAGSSPTPTTPSGSGVTPTPAATATPVAASPTPTATATPASAANPLATATIQGGPAFVTSTGFATYFYTGDTTPNQSNCTGGCLAAWPPVSAPAGALPVPWSEFTRSDDGVVQLTYNGSPIYTFASDTQAGVATGNGVAGFILARPAATATPTPQPPGYALPARHGSH
jgi:predicted lipoprotein with Yx(FWY)xxD motif